MTTSARMASTPLTELLPRTLRPFNVLAEMPHTVFVYENCSHNNVATDRVTFASNYTQLNNGTDRNSHTQNTNSRRDEDWTDGDNDSLIGVTSIAHNEAPWNRQKD